MEPKVNIALEAARKGGKELLRFKDEVDKMDICLLYTSDAADE